MCQFELHPNLGEPEGDMFGDKWIIAVIDIEIADKLSSRSRPNLSCALKFWRCHLKASPAIHGHLQSQSSTAALANVLIMYKVGNAPSAPTCVMRITTVSSTGSLFQSVLHIPRQP